MPIPIIKGIPATEIIKLLAEGCDYEEICRRYPGLDWLDIREAVRFRNEVLVSARLAEGKTRKEIALEFGFSVENVRLIVCKAARDKELRERWGGLSARTVTLVKKILGCRSLPELLKKSLTEEELLARKWIGWQMTQELRKVLPLQAAKPHRATQRGPMDITEAAHFQEILRHPPITRRDAQRALFIQALVNAAGEAPLKKELPTQVPCMAGPRKTWCLGIIIARRTGTPPEIHWACPACGKGGVIRNPEVLP